MCLPRAQSNQFGAAEQPEMAAGAAANTILVLPAEMAGCRHGWQCCPDPVATLPPIAVCIPLPLSLSLSPSHEQQMQCN